MEREIFKELLRDIKSNNYELPQGKRPIDLALEMMNYIGDTDAELRDKLVLSILTNWIMKGIFSVEETQKILNISLNKDHLLYGLGKTDDTVFARTFSVLIVAAAIYRHRYKSYLSREEVSSTLDSVILFYSEDKDVRSFINDKGWADGVSHGADALDELARCKEVGYEELKRILEAIYKKVNIGYYGYIHEEDERMVTAVVGVLERKLIPDNEVIEWIRGFGEAPRIGQLPHDLTLIVNVKSFLRSLYFRLVDKAEYNDFTMITKEVLVSMSRYK